jgi:hypothetical protein
VRHDFGQHLGEQVLDHLQHIVAVHEGHLEIELGKLRLAVTAQVFVTEAARNLEIAFHTRHHQSCLSCCGDCGSA